VEAREAFAELQKRFPRHPITYKADKAIEYIDGLLRAMEQGEPEAPKPEPKAKPPEPVPDTNPAPKG
jgi:hypothetical protein